LAGVPRLHNRNAAIEAVVAALVIWINQDAQVNHWDQVEMSQSVDEVAAQMAIRAAENDVARPKRIATFRRVDKPIYSHY
jgi:hypothetical protein